MSFEEICKEHQEKKTLACFTDKSKICYECVLFGQHKDHDTRPLKGIKATYEARQQQLLKIVLILDEHYHQINKNVREVQTSMEKTIKYRFQELQQLLKSKEIELLHGTEVFFDYQRQQIHEAFGEHSKLRQKLTEKIAEYQQPQGEDFFKLMEEDLEALTSKLSLQALNVTSQQFEKELHSSIDGLDKRLSKLIPLFHSTILLQGNMSKVCSEYFSNYLDQPPASSYEPHHQLQLKTNLHIELKNDSLAISFQENGLRDTRIKSNMLKNINHVILNISQIDLSNHDIITLQYIWKHIGKPSSLKLKCDSEDVTNDVLSRVLFTTSTIIDELNEFSVKLGSCKLIDDESIIPLVGKIIPRMSNLKSLCIWLFDTSISDQSIKTFVKYCPDVIKSLSAIKINLGNTSITDTSIVPLFFPMPLITDFYLNVRGTKISDASIEAFTDRSLLSMSNLQKSELYLSNTLVTDKFIAFPPNLSGIKKFGLGLGGIKIEEEFLPKLVTDCLEKMISLEHLTLTIYDLKIGDTEAACLCIPMKTLKKMIVNFDKTNITDKTIELFSDVTLSSISDLQEIEVYLNETNITDAGALKLFKNIQNLQKFTVDLSNTKITNKFMVELLNNILPAMKRLKIFDLDMENTEVSEEMDIQMTAMRTKIIEANKISDV